MYDILPVYPYGLTHLFGLPGSGTTTLALRLAVDAFRKGKKVLYVDFDAGLSPSFLEFHGAPSVNTETFMLAYPSTLERGFAVALFAIAEKWDFIVLDGVDYAPFPIEEDGEVGILSFLAANIPKLKEGPETVGSLAGERGDPTTTVLAIQRYRFSLGSPPPISLGIWSKFADLRIRVDKPYQGDHAHGRGDGSVRFHSWSEDFVMHEGSEVLIPKIPPLE